MQTIRTYLRQVSFVMALAMVMTALWSIPATAGVGGNGVLETGVVGTGELLTDQRVDLDRQSLLNMLEKQEVKEMLADMGVSEAQVEERIQSLTPAELSSFEQQLAQAPAGEGVVGIIVLFLLVFIVTDMLCATDIFPFVNCIR